MGAIMGSMPASKPPSVCILALEESSGAVLYGLYEVLTVFSDAWTQATGDTDCAAEFEVRIVAPELAAFRCVGGVPVIPQAALADIDRSDVVIVTDLAIDLDSEHGNRWSAITDWLTRLYDTGSLLCSVCSGSVLLASSGLLDDQPATTHWAFIDYFRRFYPQVRLEPNRILVPLGSNNRIVTTGGMASWEDLALYLIARFHGEAMAIKAAKLFLFGDRSEGQLLFSAMQKPRRHEDGVIATSQQWIASHYDSTNPVQRMVEQSGLAVRSFKRRFKSATGYTPIDYVQKLRIEEAKHLLVTSVSAVDAIARDIGYEDPTSFRRLFKRQVGVTPGRYRQRFQTATGGNIAPRSGRLRASTSM
jgi:transcriptional regulator GlxA family with amidase domain